MFSSMFTNSAAGNGGSSGTRPEQPDQRPNADQVFGDVFEDVRHLLSPTVSPFFTLQRMRNATTAHPSFFFFLSLLYCIASTARGRAAFPVVGLVRRGMRCRFRVHHRQRARPRRWYICGQSTWGHSRRKGQERGRRILRVGRATESRGTWNTFLSLTGRARALFFNLTNCTTCLQILRVLALKVLGVAYT
jgi:hypothetical protein